MNWLLVALPLAALALLVWRRSWPVDYRHPRVLMYHMIDRWQPGQKWRGLRVAPSDFEAQLAWLAAEGWHFAKMSEWPERHRLPVKSVFITFDDGYRDNFTQALPLLQHYGACATLYLVVNRHDNDWSTNKKAHHNSGELLREEKLTDSEVEQMLASGCFELGGHTLDHSNLLSLSDDECWRQISACKTALEAQYGCRVSSFAYPFGLYQPRDAELVEQAGYSSAVTVEEGIDTDPAPYDLMRIKVSGKDSLALFKYKLYSGRRGWFK